MRGRLCPGVNPAKRLCPAKSEHAPPRTRRGDNPEAQRYVSIYNAVLRTLAQSRQVPFIDLYEAIDPLPEFRPDLPAAVIWGTADRSHQGTDRQSVRRYVPEADYIERDDLGHFPDLEAPELIAEVAQGLLERR